MSRANDMAFPAPQSDTPNNTIQCGLTLREYFAGLAMQGLLACGANEPHANYEWCANRAVAMADALLAELSKAHP